MVFASLQNKILKSIAKQIKMKYNSKVNFIGWCGTVGSAADS